MGYSTYVDGEIVIDPPVTQAEREASGLDFDDMDVKLSDEGDAILPASEDSYKAYEIDEDLQKVVDAFKGLPGRTFSGKLCGEGEENDDMWRLKVVDGKVVRQVPEIIWPD